MLLHSTIDDPFAMDEEEEASFASPPPSAATAASSASASASSKVPPPSAAALAAASSYITPPKFGALRSTSNAAAAAAVASSSAPQLSGQAHMFSLLHKQGKSLPRSAERPRSAAAAASSSSYLPRSSGVDSAASAFDALMRGSAPVVSAARASYLAGMRRLGVQRDDDKPSKVPLINWLDMMDADDEAPATESETSPPLFAQSRKKNGVASGRASPAPAASSTPPVAAAVSKRPSRALSSSSAERSSSSSSSTAATAAALTAAAAAGSAGGSRPSSAGRSGGPSPPVRSSSARASPVPRVAAAAAVPAAVVAAAKLFSSRRAPTPTPMDDADNDLHDDFFADEHAATQSADDDEDEEADDSEGFSFSANGPLAREQAAQAAAAKQAEFKAAIKKREQAEQAKLERKKRKRAEEQEKEQQEKNKLAAQSQSQSQLPVAKKPSPNKTQQAQGSYSPKSVVADCDDPFDDIFASPSPPPAAATSSSTPPAASSSSSSTRATNGRTTSVARGLPAHVAVCVGSTRLPPPAPPKKVPSPPPAAAATAERMPPAPALTRTHRASELLLMRTKNLALKSNSTLLLEALLGKQSQELREVEDLALTPAQKIALQRKTSILTPAAGGNGAAVSAGGVQQPPTFASVLEKKTGRKLKPKQGEGVGHNAKQRNRARRTDGFVGDMSPLLERTVEYLLANGADPNTEDADRNRALWIALQIKGSDRVVQMLLEKGAECTEALESEDESSDEDEPDQAKRAAAAIMAEEEKENAAATARAGPVIAPFKPAQIAPSVRALRKAGAHPSLPQTLRELQAASGGAGDVFNCTSTTQRQ